MDLRNLDENALNTTHSHLLQAYRAQKTAFNAVASNFHQHKPPNLPHRTLGQRQCMRAVKLLKVALEQVESEIELLAREILAREERDNRVVSATATEGALEDRGAESRRTDPRGGEMLHSRRSGQP